MVFWLLGGDFSVSERKGGDGLVSWLNGGNLNILFFSFGYRKTVGVYRTFCRKLFIWRYFQRWEDDYSGRRQV